MKPRSARLILMSVFLLVLPACSDPGVGGPQRCGSDPDCPEGMGCSQGVCRTRCITSNDCFSGWQCLTGFCYQQCTRKEDCQEGERCENGFCWVEQPTDDGDDGGGTDDGGNDGGGGDQDADVPDAEDGVADGLDGDAAGGCIPECAAGEICILGSCCQLAMACGSICCNSGQTCSGNSCIDCARPLCNSVCCNATDLCLEGKCCAPDALCGTSCCDAGEVCELDQCVRDCGELVRCGEGQVCCAAGWVCYFGVCTEPSGPCDTSLDCADTEYCDLELGVCLPLGSVGDCQYVPGTITGEFNRPIVRWEWTDGNIITAPAVGNLTDDNADGVIDDRDIPDIVVAAYPFSYWSDVGTLHVLSGDDGRVLQSHTTYPVETGTGIAIGDVDGDQQPEVVACSTGGGMYLFGADGTLESIIAEGCRGAIYGILYTAPAIADLEGDGVVEIVSDYTIISGGVFRCVAPGYDSINSYTVPTDINGDGVLEVVGGNTAMDAQCQILWSKTDVCEGHPAIADLDQDGLPEIVVGSDLLYIMDAESGDFRWPPRAIVGEGGYCIYAFAPAIADFDGDGAAEIVLAGHSSFTVYDVACQPGGGPGVCGSATSDMVLWTSPTDDASGYAGPSAFDFEGDGKAEVVYADQTILRVYRGDDGTVLYEDERASGTLWEYPLIVDVDNDNHAEIVVVSNNDIIGGVHKGVRVFADSENNWVGTRKIWNQHAYHVTNIDGDGGVPTVQDKNWLVPGLNDFRENRLLEGLFASPDLIASDVLAGDNLCPERLTLMVRVVNQGAATTPIGVPVSFYQVAADDSLTYLGTAYTTRRLSPGESEVVSFDFILPPDSLEVLFTFLVKVDTNPSGAGIIHECHEDNNLSIRFTGVCSYSH